ncbi:MAG: hypothetical protein HY675_25565 [Chloroflexi bacterium]|nr:hypothetical protein [Chloroflexota bacterium]
MVDQSYWFKHNLKDYFYAGIDALPDYGLPDTAKRAVGRAKQIIANTQECERREMWTAAEQEIRKLIPPL